MKPKKTTKPKQRASRIPRQRHPMHHKGFECPMCGNVSRTRSALQGHLNDKHYRDSEDMDIIGTAFDGIYPAVRPMEKLVDKRLARALEVNELFRMYSLPSGPKNRRR